MIDSVYQSETGNMHITTRVAQGLAYARNILYDYECVFFPNGIEDIPMLNCIHIDHNYAPSATFLNKILNNNSWRFTPNV